MSSAKLLRSMLQGPKMVLAPGAYDPLSARIIERTGFEAVYVTGGGVARSFGLPDMGLLSMTEVVDRVRAICEATSLPVIADADAGYGNPLNVYRAVRAFMKAGVAGLHLEDQVSPKKCGHYDGKAVVSPEEMVKKIEAAIEARGDSDLVIIARTDALAVNGYDDAIQRATAYLAAGADMAFVEAPTTVEQLERIPKDVPGPVMVNVIKGAKTPLLPAAELEKFGYRLAIFPNDTQRAAIQAISDVLQVLKRDGSTEAFTRMASFMEREEIVGKAYWDQLEQRFQHS